MSGIRSLPKFSFVDIEKCIKDNLNKVCGSAADDHMKNLMVNEKFLALHFEKGTYFENQHQNPRYYS